EPDGRRRRNGPATGPGRRRGRLWRSLRRGLPCACLPQTVCAVPACPSPLFGPDAVAQGQLRGPLIEKADHGSAFGAAQPGGRVEAPRLSSADGFTGRACRLRRDLDGEGPPVARMQLPPDVPVTLEAVDQLRH